MRINNTPDSNQVVMPSASVIVQRWMRVARRDGAQEWPEQLETTHDQGISGLQTARLRQSARAS